MKYEDNAFCGVLTVDKPEGFTSFDLCAKLRGMLKTRRIGHSGTLDPMATGVMVILIGQATKAAELLPLQDKRYIAAFQFGLRTDTLDITGEVLERQEFSVPRSRLEEALSAFRGDIMQLPPMYSAVHSGGQRLYQLARQGIEIEREARPVTITRLEIISYDPEKGCGELDVTCSKGTYIRSLIDDIGTSLGTCAVMTALRRTQASGFEISDALTLGEVQRLCDEGAIAQHILPVDSALSGYPDVRVTAAQGVRYANGGALDLARLHLPDDTPDGFVRVYDAEKFIGLGILSREKGELRPYKRFI